MTGLALLASYIEEIRIGLTRLGTMDLSMPNGDVVSTANATFVDFMNYYDVTLIIRLSLSGQDAFNFTELTTYLVHHVSGCATGLIFGVTGVLGLLIGGLSSGFVLAIFMANAGGAWDNAKKYVEEGNFGGKGGEVHKATVVGDTVGDPFKDTSGPSLNILIKLMSMVAIVMAGLTVAWSLF